MHPLFRFTTFVGVLINFSNEQINERINHYHDDYSSYNFPKLTKLKRNSFVYLFGETDQNIIGIISLPSSDEKSSIRTRLSLASVSRVRVSR